MKRKRDLRERKRPRKSRLETHRDDEPGRPAAALGAPHPPGPAHPIDRFPGSSKNSFRDSRRRLLVEPPLLVLVRRPVVQRRVQPLPVVDPFDELIASLWSFPSVDMENPYRTVLGYPDPYSCS